MFANRKIATDHLVPPVEQRHAPAPARGDDVMADLTGDPRLTTAPVHVRAAAAAPAVVMPPPVPDLPPGTVVFTQPYQNLGDDVKSVRFRAPQGRDVKRAGTPLRVEFDGKTIKDIDYRWPAIVEYVHLLSEPQLLPSTVDRMTFEDLAACAEVIRDFFLQTRMS